MHTVAAVVTSVVAACAVVTLQGCGGGGEETTTAPTPAPTPKLPDYQCTGACHIHTECELHDGHDHVHYHQHDCKMEPPSPEGSCADYSAQWESKTEAEKKCHQSLVCCRASNRTDTVMCTNLLACLPEYSCAGGCHFHPTCTDDNSVHLEQHGCALPIEDPEPTITCADWAWMMMHASASDQECPIAERCCQATNQTDTASCAKHAECSNTTKLVI